MAAREQEILVGGQAVMEGVMMKLARSWAVTVRRANGELVSQSGAIVPWSDRWRGWKLPFLRGIAVLCQMLALGMKTLFFSSDILAKDLEAQEAAEKAAGSEAGKASSTKKPPSLLTLAGLALFSVVVNAPDGTEADDDAGDAATAKPVPATPAPEAGGLRTRDIVLSAGMALALFVLVFKALPLGIAWLAARAVPALGTPLAESIISGLALACVFVSYLGLMSLIPDIRRVFQYHGAEHKVVHLSEAGLAPTVENARPFTTLHPRCGTSFLFFMVLTSIVVWSLFPIDAGYFAKLGLRLALFPLILGTSFELIRLSARHPRRLLFRVLMAPGLWSQRITTKPPDDGMLEVSLHSYGLARQGHEGQAPIA